jgi:drug/metabolite transporter (DMT)-like permease
VQRGYAGKVAWRVLAVALFAQALGGLTPVWTKLALAGFEPWTLVFLRQLLGLPMLVAIARAGRAKASGGRERWSARDIGLLLLVSWAGFALPQVLLAIGIQRSTATASALLTPLEPIGIVVGSAIFFSERLDAARIAAVLLGTLGASLIVLQDGLHPELGDVVGDLWIAAGHLAWAIYTLAAKALLERHDEGGVSLLAVGLSLVPLGALAATESQDLDRAADAFVWLLALAGLSTALGTWLWNWALQRTGAGRMGILVFAQPAIGVLGASLALGERIGSLALLGSLVILASLALELRGRSAPID